MQPAHGTGLLYALSSSGYHTTIWCLATILIMPTITQQNLDSLEPLDHEWVQKRLREFPFVLIDGVTNARSLGSYPIRRQENGGCSEEVTRPKQLYRSAEVSGITDKGDFYCSSGRILLTSCRKGSATGAKYQEGL